MLLLFLLSLSFSFPNNINREIPGDINGDGVVDIVDIVLLVNNILDGDFTNFMFVPPTTISIGNDRD